MDGYQKAIRDALKKGESLLLTKEQVKELAGVAQLVEPEICNFQVLGSSPSPCSNVEIKRQRRFPPTAVAEMVETFLPQKESTSYTQSDSQL